MKKTGIFFGGRPSDDSFSEAFSEGEAFDFEEEGTRSGASAIFVSSSEPFGSNFQ